MVGLLRRVLFGVLVLGVVVGSGLWSGPGLGGARAAAASVVSAETSASAVSSASVVPAVEQAMVPTAWGETERVAGPDRYATAAAIAQRSFPEPFAAGEGVVYLARGDVFADALVGGTLRDGPVLLVRACGTLPPVVRAEIDRLDPARVVALGGPVSVCPEVLAAAAEGRAVSRLAGADRYGTAAAVAAHAFPEGPVAELYVASGDGGSPDAVAGGVLTAGPILLVRPGGAVPEATAEQVARLDPYRVLALGGQASVPQVSLEAAAGGRELGRLAGADRYATAAAIAAHAFPRGVQTVYLARGDVFADAVAAGSLVDGPVLLVRACGAVPGPVADLVKRTNPQQVVALGGPSSVCEDVLTGVAGLVTAPQVPVSLAPETEILTPAELGQVESFDPATGDLVLGDGAASLASLTEGDIVVAGFSEAVPTGFLRRVVDVDVTPAGYVLSTTEAELPDAVADTGGVLVGGEAELVASYVEPGPGVEVVDGAVPAALTLDRPAFMSPDAVEVNLEHTLKIRKQWKASTGDEDANFTGTGTANVDATVKVGGKMSADAKISWFTLDELILKATPSAEASVNADITGELEGTASPAIGKVTRFWNLQVGPLPVMFVETTDVTIDASITTSGKIGITTGIRASSTVGIHYKNGTVSPILESGGTTTPPSLVAEAVAGVGLQVGPQTDLRVYGIAGLKSKAGPFAKATVTMTESEAFSCKLQAGLAAELSAVAGINILGLKAELEQGRDFSVTLFDEELCLDDAVDPDPDLLTVTTTSLPDAHLNEPYEVQLEANGGTPPYTWTRTAGTLPAGIRLIPDGTLSGTPLSEGHHEPILQVADSAGSTATRTLPLAVLVDEGPDLPLPGAGVAADFEVVFDREYFTGTVLLPDGSLNLCSVGSGTNLPTIEVKRDGAWNTSTPECVIAKNANGLSFAQRELLPSGGIELVAAENGETLWNDPARQIAWPTGFGDTLAAGEFFEIIDPRSGASLGKLGETRFTGFPTEARANAQYGAIATTSTVRYFDRETLELTPGGVVSEWLIQSAALLNDLTGITVGHADRTYSCTARVTTSDPTGPTQERRQSVSEWDECDFKLVSAGQHAYLLVRHAGFEGQAEIGTDLWMVRRDGTLQWVREFGRWADVAGDESGQAVLVEGDRSLTTPPANGWVPSDWRAHLISGAGDVTLIAEGSAYGQHHPSAVLGFGQAFLQWVDFKPEDPNTRSQHVRSVVVPGLEGESGRTSFHRPELP